jgi:hypothetical protein
VKTKIVPHIASFIDVPLAQPSAVLNGSLRFDLHKPGIVRVEMLNFESNTKLDVVEQVRADLEVLLGDAAEELVAYVRQPLASDGKRWWGRYGFLASLRTRSDWNAAVAECLEAASGRSLKYPNANIHDRIASVMREDSR